MTTAGQIGIDLILNSTSFKKSLNNIQTKANNAGTKISKAFSSSINSTQAQINSAGSKISNSFGKIAKVVGTAFSVAMITRFSKECVSAANIQTEAETKLTTVMRQRMSASNKAISSVKNYASALQETGVVGDEVQLAGAQQLSTFLKTDDALKKLMPAMNNLAVQQNGVNVTSESMVNIGNLMGKVMQGQTSALTRVGITFSDAQAQVLKYGNEEQRAAMLSQVITDNVGNMNKALANTPAGRIQQLKNSFGDMQETLGRGLNNVFSPMLGFLTKIVTKLSQVASGFENLTKKIFGDSNSEQSSAGMNNLSTGADNTTTSVDNNTKAINNNAKAKKKAERSLANFDKLNVLTKTSTSTTPSSNPSTSNSSNLPKNINNNTANKAIDRVLNKWKSVINSIKNTLGKIKSALIAIGKSWVNVWKNGTGEKILSNIRKLLKHCIDNIGFIADAFTKAWEKGNLGNQVVQSILDRFNSLIELVDVIAKDFGEVWNEGVGVRIWTNILKIIRNCNNSVTALRQRITIAWNKNQLGKKIWRDILGIVEDITGWVADMSKIHLDWLENLDLYPIMSAVEKLTGAFRKLLKAIGEKLKTAYKDVLLPLAKWTIEKAVPKLVEALGDALDFVSQVINGMSAGDISAIAGALGAVGTAIVVFKAGRTIASGIDKVRGAISLFFNFINKNPAVAVFLGFASAIGAIVTAVRTYNQLTWSASEAGKFAKKIDELSSNLEKAKDNIETTLTETMDSLDKVYTDNALIDGYEKKLDELLKKATLTPEEAGQLNTIVKYFKDNVPNFAKVWNNYVQASKNGTIKLKGNQKTIRAEIKKTIEQYKNLANQQAISDLATTTTKSKISAKTELNKAENDYDKYIQKLKKQDEKVKKLKNTLIWYENSKPNSYGTDSGYLTTQTKYQGAVATLNSYTKQLSKVEKPYKEALASYTKLETKTTELSKMQGVLNGNYSDASAVLLAYNQGLISLDDVQKNTKKSLGQLKKEAKKSGKNICFGLEEGTKEYSNKLKTTKNQLAESYLKQAKDTLGIHSPSREMKKIGRYTAQGFLIGVNSQNKNVSKTMRRMWNRIKAPFTSVSEWFGNIFKGAWNAIKKAFTGVGKWFKNLFNGILKFIKAPINFLIDGLNTLIKGVNKISFDVPKWVPGIGGKKFGFDIPQIPHLAKGGLVKAPTLAVVGDNMGASSGNPEVVSPLNKLKGMIQESSDNGDTEILSQILLYLKRMYEMFIIFRNKGGNTYEFVAKINGSDIFKEIVKQNEMYKKRHNGKSAFV